MVQTPYFFAQATSGSLNVLPHITVFIAGATLALTYERWIVENRLSSQKDKLESELEHEKRDKEYWQRKANDAAKDVEIAYQALDETLKTINQQELSTNDIVRLNRILGKLKNWEGLNEELNDYKVAATELQRKLPYLSRIASKQAIKEYKKNSVTLPEILPWNREKKIQRFQRDITGYVNWIYDCMYFTGHPDNNPLSRFVEKPLLSSADPYVAAITYIRDQGGWERLTSNQVQYLKMFFDELLMQLPDEFNG
ncbi:hypothetical protein GFS31_08390 [Leptolyngbya sp. BL0902]|uniref:hypothetical protein n=1 Tax=Leptolyngbya sp. BL0902 TaxID=1115757 RepID=UPI0018E7D661|nr:hypothetical protein [Leptolyngbya sp. BL0902]QQE64160.1 hypothetical protein GFS31_08390 [Leptolyngbya sp. BL0902]